MKSSHIVPAMAVLALLSTWYVNFGAAQTHAVIPYAEDLGDPEAKRRGLVQGAAAWEEGRHQGDGDVHLDADPRPAKPN